jgi:hypothetical protein
MKTTAFVVLVAALIAPMVAVAEPGGYTSVRGWGPRVGITGNPDQVHFGMHFDVAGLGNSTRLEPNLEVGFGDARTLVAFNLEAAHRFIPAWGRWSPYLGGGVGVNMRQSDERFRESSSSDLGASFLGGIEKGVGQSQRFFLETKLGLVDSPDLKLTIGWTFFR